jgi:predicted DNA-binding WGR domain protein
MPGVHRFEFVGGGSSKFWEISYSGSQVTVRFGRIGTKGQMQTKEMGTEMAAAFHVADLIKEKLAKGYVAATHRPPGESPSVEVAGEASGPSRPPALPPYEPPPVPPDGPVAIDGVTLPSGRRLQGDPQMVPPGIDMVSEPVVWATDDPVSGCGRLLYALRKPCRPRGLVPMLVGGMEADHRRPWDSQEFAPTDPRRVDHFGAEQVLADMWRQSVDTGDEDSLAPLKPFDVDFPGLAPASVWQPPSGFARFFSQTADPADDRPTLASFEPRRIALIAASRPADVVTALGWNGAVNVHQDPVLLSVVMRSWEDRWAARVVEVGFDTMTLTVGRPPRDRDTALRLGAEHFAFCPDNIWQGSDTIAAYAATLERSRIWTFWWD